MVIHSENNDDNLPLSPVKRRKVVIESVLGKDQNIAEPVLARFTNGRPSQEGKLQGNLHQSNTNKHRCFSVDTPWMSYVGKNFGDPSAHSKTSVFSRDAIYIGILDKQTGKMKLVEASSYTLHPKVTVAAEKPEPIHEATYREKNERMVTNFGSKRAKKIMKQRQAYDVNVGGMADAIHDASKDVVVKDEDLKVSVEDENDYLHLLPSFDGEAKTPEEVYRLDWIAPDYFLSNFENTARSYLAGEFEFEEASYTNLMRVMVSVAKFEPDEENQVRLISLALYTEYLIRFTRLKSSQMKRENEILDGCSRTVKKHILDEYTKGKSRMFSAVDKDRVLCLILVLGLIGCKYELFTITLVESLQIELKKLHLLMKAIGATYINENFSFRLKFPLTRIAKSFKKMAKGIR